MRRGRDSRRCRLPCLRPRWRAAQPSALAQVAGGLWEISGVPGTKAPVRQCVADVAALAQFEHRGANCSRKVLSATAGARRSISYKCGGAGFGQSEDRGPHAALAEDQHAGNLRPAAVQLCASGAARRRLREKRLPSHAIKAPFNHFALPGSVPDLARFPPIGREPDNWAALPSGSAALLLWCADGLERRAPCSISSSRPPYPALIVAAVSEIARRYPGWGGLVASLPLTSLLAMIWLWRDSRRSGTGCGACRSSTFWFILPSLPLFLVLPWLLRSGVAFWLAMALSVVGNACPLRLLVLGGAEGGHQAVKKRSRPSLRRARLDGLRRHRARAGLFGHRADGRLQPAPPGRARRGAGDRERCSRTGTSSFRSICARSAGRR